jgi:hypothetical protein
MSPLTHRIRVARLRVRAALDRRRIRRMMRRTPGLEIDPLAANAFALATFHVEPGGRVRIAAGVATERRADAVRIHVHPGAELVIGPGTWLRTELGPVTMHVYPDARMDIGPECLLNGCQLSAKQALTIGRKSMVGPGSRLFDADQHDFDGDTPERLAPIRVGDHVWIASDVTVLRGVEIGDHAIVGAHSLVTRSIPPHSLAYGAPARVAGPVGDRSNVTH